MNNEKDISDFYDVKVKFRELKKGDSYIQVIIRANKKGRALRKRFDFPENLNNQIEWARYKGGKIVTYHRKDSYEYYSNNSRASMELAQKLEKLVIETIK